MRENARINFQWGGGFFDYAGFGQTSRMIICSSSKG
jgi:hypothetical protein